MQKWKCTFLWHVFTPLFFLNQAVPLSAPPEAWRTSVGYAAVFCCINFRGLCVFDFAMFLCLQHVCCQFVLAFCCMFFHLHHVSVVSFVLDLHMFLNWHRFWSRSTFSPNGNVLGRCCSFDLVSYRRKYRGNLKIGLKVQHTEHFFIKMIRRVFEDSWDTAQHSAKFY